MRTALFIPLCAIAVVLAPASRADEDDLKIKGLRLGKPFSQPGKFTFVRVEYESDSSTGNHRYHFEGRMWYRWETDYPEAEENFLYRIRQLTTISTDPRPISLRLTDPRLFEYPFIYMCDVGWQILNRDEQNKLRAYLLRGGFLWVDDFWGPYEWNQLERNMRRVFPNLKWRAIPRHHPILNAVFQLDECPRIPAKIFAEQGLRFDPPEIHRGGGGGIPGVSEVHLKGLFHPDTDRLMVLATHNTDIGDGWEREAEDEWYFHEYSIPAYAIGINIVVYALTH